MDSQRRNEINECILGIKKRDDASLIRLYNLIGHTIRAISIKYLRTKVDAEDLEQDFWAKIYDIADGFKYYNNGFGYLCKVMTNMARNRYKQIYGNKKYVVAPINYDILSSFDESTMVENIDDMLAVHKAMGALDDSEKLVMQLVIFEDKTIMQIAKEIRMSKSQVGRIKKAAEEKLKDKLSQYILGK